MSFFYFMSWFLTTHNCHFSGGCPRVRPLARPVAQWRALRAHGALLQGVRPRLPARPGRHPGHPGKWTVPEKRWWIQDFVLGTWPGRGVRGLVHLSSPLDPLVLIRLSYSFCKQWSFIFSSANDNIIWRYVEQYLIQILSKLDVNIGQWPKTIDMDSIMSRFDSLFLLKLKYFVRHRCMSHYPERTSI